MGKKRLKVLHLAHHYSPCIGGVERVVEDLCKGLKKEGVDCAVATLDTCVNTGEKLLREEEVDRIKIYRFPFVDLKYYKFAPSVYGLFKEYDILHVHGIGFFSDLALGFKWLHKKPVVLSTHGGISHTKKISALKKIYFNVWTKQLLKGAECVCACSKPDEEMFRKVSDKVRFMQNGVNVERFHSLSLAKEQNRFAYIGRISKNKRIELLLKAFALAKENLGEFRLYIVGQDWEGILPALEKQVKELGLREEVVFTGKVSEKGLMEHYEKARFFVSASQHEGFGISAVEAMASGCVPLLSRIPTFVQFVAGGRAGRIIDWEQPAVAAKQVVSVARNGEDVLGFIAKKAREESKQYGWAARVRQFAKLYQSIIQKSK